MNISVLTLPFLIIYLLMQSQSSLLAQNTGPFIIENKELYTTLTTPQLDTQIKQAFLVADEYVDSALDALLGLKERCAIRYHTLGEADALFYIGMIYTAYRVAPDKALYYFRESRSYYEQLQPNDSSWLMDWLNNMGSAYYMKGKTDSAIYYYEAVLSRALHKPNQDALVVTTYNNLGTVLMGLNDFDKALFYLRRAEKTGLQHKMKARLVTTWQNMAGCYAYKALNDSALLYIDKIDSLEVTLGSREAATQHSLLGFIYAQMKKYKESIQEYERSLFANPEGARRIETMNNLGASYIGDHQYTQAQRYLLQALEEARNGNLADKDKDKVLVANINSALANLYDSLGDYKQAYHYRSQASIMMDSTHALEKDEEIHRIETQYRMAEKDKEIAETQVHLLAAMQATKNRNSWLLAIGGGTMLLSLVYLSLFQRQRLKLQRAQSQEQQAQISRLQATIEGEENERSRIGRQLHDEVMVEFSIVKMNMIALQEHDQYVRQLSEYDHLSRQLEVACLKLRQSAHNLMPDGLMEEGLIAAINYFCTSIQASSHIRVSFQHFGVLPELATNQAINIYRIIQELVQNVIKHAEASRLLVQMSCREGQIYLTVEDDGKGMSNKIKVEDGMGLKSIRFRLKAMNGKMDIHPVKPNGTSIQIEVDAPAWLP